MPTRSRRSSFALASVGDPFGEVVLVAEDGLFEELPGEPGEDQGHGNAGEGNDPIARLSCCVGLAKNASQSGADQKVHRQVDQVEGIADRADPDHGLPAQEG